MPLIKLAHQQFQTNFDDGDDDRRIADQAQIYQLKLRINRFQPDIGFVIN